MHGDSKEIVQKWLSSVLLETIVRRISYGNCNKSTGLLPESQRVAIRARWPVHFMISLSIYLIFMPLLKKGREKTSTLRGLPLISKRAWKRVIGWKNGFERPNLWPKCKILRNGVTNNIRLSVMNYYQDLFTKKKQKWPEKNSENYWQNITQDLGYHSNFWTKRWGHDRERAKPDSRKA